MYDVKYGRGTFNTGGLMEKRKNLLFRKKFYNFRSINNTTMIINFNKILIKADNLLLKNRAFKVHSRKYFLKRKNNLLLLTNYYKNFFFLLSNNHLKFTWFRIVLFSGLGYKRKIISKKKFTFTYTADRHWILHKLGYFSSILPMKKRNFIFISNSKNSLRKDYNFFSTLHKPYVYKMKGFLDSRVRRRFLFVRRIRLRGIKAKLSKKQKFL